MKPHSNKPGARENTASPRQHASRLAVSTHPNDIQIEEADSRTAAFFPKEDSRAEELKSPVDPAPRHPVNWVESRGENHFLNVQEVAAMLQVPVSWVYGRMRKRARYRLPGYRLGKYWRFSEIEVLAWVKSQHGDPDAA
jgi:excisionase family DNA binding protein